MKKPDEIKKGLEVCSKDKCVCDECEFGGNVRKWRKLMGYALAYIRQLETRLAQVERERDAAVRDIREAKWFLCHVCQNYYRPDPAVRHYECKVLGKFSDIFSPSDFAEEDDNPISMCGKFKWRGVCEENTKEE